MTRRPNARLNRLLRFAIVGGLGFLTDAVLLAVLIRTTPLGPFLARLVSVSIAMIVTFMLNRGFTFERSGRHIAAEGARYGSVSIAVSLLNYLIYSACLLAVPGLPPLVALAIASGGALILSFLGYSRFVFSR